MRSFFRRQIEPGRPLRPGFFLTLTGGANDFFVVNVSSGFDLVGNGGIVAGSGIDASHVIVNIIGTGSTITSHVGNEIDATVNSLPLSPPPLVPTPTALAAGAPVFPGLGLIGWIRGRRAKRT